MPGSSNSQNNYSMYNYFRERPSILIAFATFVFSFISAIINHLFVVIQTRYCLYWGYNELSIRYSGKTNAFVFLAFFCLCVLSSAISLYISNTIEVFIKNLTHYAKIRKKIKEIKTETKKIRKEAKKRASEINKEAELTLIGRLKDIDKENNEHKKIIDKIRLYLLKELAKTYIQIIICLLLLYCFLVSLIPIMFDKTVLLGIIKQSFLLPIIASTLYFVIIYSYYRNNKDDDELDNELFIKKARELLVQFLRIKDRKVNLKELLNNSNIISSIKLCLIVFVILFIVISFFFPRIVNSGKTFSVVEYHNDLYAVIIAGDDYLYCNKAIIKDNSIYISENNHLILNKTNIVMLSKDYEEVFKVENLDSTKFEE